MLQTFKNMRDLIGVMSAYCRLESAIVEELEAQNKRLYALEENQRMAKGTRRDLMLRVSNLERSVFGKDRAPDKPTEKELVSA